MKAASHENDFGSWSGEDDSTHLHSTTLKLRCRLWSSSQQWRMSWRSISRYQNRQKYKQATKHT